MTITNKIILAIAICVANFAGATGVYPDSAGERSPARAQPARSSSSAAGPESRPSIPGDVSDKTLPCDVLRVGPWQFSAKGLGITGGGLDGFRIVSLDGPAYLMWKQSNPSVQLPPLLRITVPNRGPDKLIEVRSGANWCRISGSSISNAFVNELTCQYPGITNGQDQYTDTIVYLDPKQLDKVLQDTLSKFQDLNVTWREYGEPRVDFGSAGKIDWSFAGSKHLLPVTNPNTVGGINAWISTMVRYLITNQFDPFCEGLNPLYNY